ncbi:prolyl-tRNA synthetase associated domain-containing protein [Sutterella faecalis]|uniref:Prolyl-tRNA synthetase associated domain-containing protein n=2 Tax=Sutterella TaxID=40544 RepID=A0AAI9SBK3_9BURK|nr:MULTISPECIES: YbaK/EbsC family protein [Sutterella]KAB7650850.1 prolyl-tRNA synthetase associated domain-containing protein [Sutterella seckii]QDA55281.1 prolyl-tRNA synthetase associated domain-containing protein [Sutterella faecalis]
MQKPDEIIEGKLRELGIPYERHDHAPIMTVEEGRVLACEYGSFCMKNLFLTAKKRFYLLMMPSEKSFSSKALAKQLGCGHISFGSPEKLAECLRTYPGAVTCLGLLFDEKHQVEVLVDKALLEVPLVDAHPCSNAASIKLAMKDILEVWLPATGHADWKTVEID